MGSPLAPSCGRTADAAAACLRHLQVLAPSDEILSIHRHAFPTTPLEPVLYSAVAAPPVRQVVPPTPGSCGAAAAAGGSRRATRARAAPPNALRPLTSIHCAPTCSQWHPPILLPSAMRALQPPLALELQQPPRTRRREAHSAALAHTQQLHAPASAAPTHAGHGAGVAGGAALHRRAGAWERRPIGSAAAAA